MLRMLMTVMLRLSMTELPCLHRLLLVATAVCDILALITSAKEVTFSSLSVCLLATLRKNFQRDLHEIFREGWRWADKQMIKFWWRSRSWIWICIAMLVRHALAEVCTVTLHLHCVPKTSAFLFFK